MIGVFLVRVGLVRIVRDLAKEKLSRFFSSQAGFFTFLRLQNYSMSLYSTTPCLCIISTGEIMQQPSPSDIPVLYNCIYHCSN